jgi:hypothetical protein
VWIKEAIFFGARQTALNCTKETPGDFRRLIGSSLLVSGNGWCFRIIFQVKLPGKMLKIKYSADP